MHDFLFGFRSGWRDARMPQRAILGIAIAAASITAILLVLAQLD